VKKHEETPLHYPLALALQLSLPFLSFEEMIAGPKIIIIVETK
jgi:hypothetical protein